MSLVIITENDITLVHTYVRNLSSSYNVWYTKTTDPIQCKELRTWATEQAATKHVKQQPQEINIWAQMGNPCLGEWPVWSGFPLNSYIQWHSE